MRESPDHDRKQLYDEVWAEPARDVAARFGLSVEGLREACRRLGIPFPGEGYWARKAAGLRAHRPQLPFRAAPQPKAQVPIRPARRPKRPPLYPVTPAKPKVSVRSARRHKRSHAKRELSPDAPADTPYPVPTGDALVFPSLSPAAQAIPLESLWYFWPPACRRLCKHGVLSAGDVARMTEDEFFSVRCLGEVALAKVRRALDRLTAEVEAFPDGASQGGQALHDEIASRHPLLQQVQERMTRCSGPLLFIAHRRTFSDVPGAQFQTLASELGVSRERARQIELDIWERMGSMRRSVGVADDRIAQLRRGRTRPLTIQELESADPWFAGVEAMRGVVRALLEHYEARHRVVRLSTRQDAILVPAILASPERWADRFGVHFDPHTGSRAALNLAVRTALVAEGAPELVDAFLAELTVLLPARLILGAVILKVLEASRDPLTVDQLRQRIASGFGLDATPKRIRTEAGRLGLARPKPKTYMLRERLAEWDAHRDRARAAAIEVIRSSSRTQWSGRDLLVALRRRKEPWIKGAGPHVIVHLLRDAPEFRWLGRGILGLRADGRRGRTDRLSVQETALQVLRSAGHPMRLEELHEGVSARRSITVTVRYRWPIVSMGGGAHGLADRDLGLDLHRVSDFGNAVNAELARAGVAGAHALKECFRRAWPSASLPSQTVIARLAADVCSARLDSERTGLLRRITGSATSAATTTVHPSSR